MTVIRHDVISGTALVDAHLPRIGYTNLFRGGTVTVSSQDDDHPKELAYDGLTYDAWRTTGAATEWIQTQVSAQNADYMAVAAHTLVGCNVTPQHSPDGSAWTDIETAYTVPDNWPIVWEFTSISKAYWRLLIQNATGVVSIGAIHVGLKVSMQNGMPVGWAPPQLNEEVIYTNSGSEGGQTLGRSIVRRGSKATVQTPFVDFVWARDTWMAFRDVADLYAVFLWWSYLSRGEIVYGAMTKSSVQFSTEQLVTTSFDLAGITR